MPWNAGESIKKVDPDCLGDCHRLIRNR